MTARLTPHSKTGMVRDGMQAVVSGPSRLKEELSIPMGVTVHFIGHWVVADLSWMAGMCSTLTQHDAEHYGIEIPESNVTTIREVTP